MNTTGINDTEGPTQASDVLLRPARKEDCEAMMGLIRELAEISGASKDVTVTMEHFVESGFGAHPVFKAIVAELGGRVVAFALYYIRYSTWKGQQLYLEDLVVTKKYRGQSIGTRLLERLVQEAKEQNFSGVVWQILDRNTPAIQFYQKQKGVQYTNQWINCTLDT